MHAAKGSVNQTEFINTTGSVSEQATFERFLIRSCLAQRWFIKPQNFSRARLRLGRILLTSSRKLDFTLSIIISSQKKRGWGGEAKFAQMFPCPVVAGRGPHAMPGTR